MIHDLLRPTGHQDRIADRRLHERIALTDRTTSSNLADTFDATLERLDRSFDSQRRFAAGAGPFALRGFVPHISRNTPGGIAR